MDKEDAKLYWNVWGPKGHHRSHLKGKSSRRRRRKLRLPPDLARLVV